MRQLYLPSISYSLEFLYCNKGASSSSHFANDFFEIKAENKCFQVQKSCLGE